MCMKNRKHKTLTALVASMVCIGIVSSLILSLPLLNQVSAQDKTGEDMEMMNTGSGSGLKTGSLNANMTMDQMLDMMDMMHNMMMNMMRMMMSQNAGMMNTSSNMMGTMNMNTGMK